MTLARRACPICDSLQMMHLTDIWDDRFGQPDVFQLQECRTCRLAFLNTIVHPSETECLYAKYYARPVSESLRLAKASSGLLAVWARWLDGNINPGYTVESGETVLDVGCGTGAVLEIGKALGANMEGLEVDPAVADMVAARGFECHKGTLTTCASIANRRYDRVILNQVLEHLDQPVEALKCCRQILREDGEVVVASPCLDGFLRRIYGRRWISWHAPYHVSHFSRKALTIAARKAGLDVKSFRLRTPGNWILAQLAMGKAARGVRNPRFRTEFPLWRRALVAPLGRLADLLQCGEGFLAVLTPARSTG
jgi:2-polyprenyl-3-methyl-5-hydroxy-6-metoxy-1,4-benzoquinol methylase